MYDVPPTKLGTSHTGLFEIWTSEVGIGVKNNSSVTFEIVIFFYIP